MTKKRVDFIDLYRGIGILLMIMGHVYFGRVFDKFIHAFHMPMFFFLTGYFFKQDNGNVSGYVIKKAQILLIPYFVYGIFDIGVYGLVQKVDIRHIFEHFLWENTDELYTAGALWFLTAMFIATVLYKILDILINNLLIKSLVISTISIMGVYATSIFSHRLPWAFDVACVAIGFMHIGRIIRMNQKNRLVHRVLNLNCAEIGGVGAVTIILIFLNGYVNLREGQYSMLILFWLNALMSIIVLWNLSKNLSKINLSHNIAKKIEKSIMYIGANSIIYLCLNQVVIYLVDYMMPLNINILVAKIITLIITIILLSAISLFVYFAKEKFILYK